MNTIAVWLMVISVNTHLALPTQPIVFADKPMCLEQAATLNTHFTQSANIIAAVCVETLLIQGETK